MGAQDQVDKFTSRRSLIKCQSNFDAMFVFGTRVLSTRRGTRLFLLNCLREIKVCWNVADIPFI
jgi:hypothetical protein